MARHLGATLTQVAARHFAASAVPTTNRVELLRLAVQMAELKARIGGRMRELREERKENDPKWTQDYVARLVEPMLSGTQMSRWERGENRPEDDRLERIAEIYETSVADLYAGPVADRKPKGQTPDVLRQLDGAANGELAALREAVDELRAEVRATRTGLLGEIGKVRKAQEALQRTQAPGQRKSGATGT